MGSIAIEDVPEVEILLLGDAEVGMSSFLSYVFDSNFSVPSQPQSRSSQLTQLSRRLSLGRNTTNDAVPPPYSLPKLRDMDQPFSFDIKMYNRPYRFSFYDTASPQNYTLLRPHLIVLCYDISRRATLESIQGRWKKIVEAHFNYDEALPVLLLGLKRDLRKEWTETDKSSIMPQEALRIAQEMRCDRYAECSATSGELCAEVLEDVARLAAMTTTVGGAKTPAGCQVM